MKSFYALAVAGLVAVASAQLDSLPSCALSCLTKGLPKTGCSITDFKCACSNEAFVSGSATCIQSSCSADEQEAALAGAVALCKSAGVDIPSTFPGSGASSTAAPSSSAAPSAPASSSAAPTTAAPSSAAPSSAPLESIPSVVPSITASATITKSTVAVPSPSSGNGTGNGSYVPPQETAPDSGSGRLTAGLSAVALAVAAVLAF